MPKVLKAEPTIHEVMLSDITGDVISFEVKFFQERKNLDETGKNASSVFCATQEQGQTVMFENLKIITCEYNDGKIFLGAVGNSAVLILITVVDTPIGMVRLVMESAAHEFERELKNLDFEPKRPIIDWTALKGIPKKMPKHYPILLLGNLAKFPKMVPEITTVTLTDRNGRFISNNSKNTDYLMDVAKFSTITSAIFHLNEVLGKYMPSGLYTKLGHLNIITSEFENGKIFITANDTSILSLVTVKDVNIGMIRLMMKTAMSTPENLHEWLKSSYKGGLEELRKLHRKFQ